MMFRFSLKMWVGCATISSCRKGQFFSVSSAGGKVLGYYAAGGIFCVIGVRFGLFVGGR